MLQLRGIPAGTRAFGEGRACRRSDLGFQKIHTDEFYYTFHICCYWPAISVRVYRVWYHHDDELLRFLKP
jgi:hypothetical protein